jgi:SAM-dependent methyltransferase
VKHLTGPSDDSLVEGSSAHYAEPSYYEKCYVKRTDDVHYYTKLASAFSERPVLEYGCGHGRIALPIARQGNPVVGVDLSAPMLEAFRQRLACEARDVRRRVRLVQGDMRSVRMRRRFDLVLCTFNTFLHLYDRVDVERFLARVRAHMTSDGRFVFDTSMPMPEELARDPNRPFRVPRLRYPPTGQLVRYAETFDYDRVTQVLRINMTFEPMDAPRRAWSTLLTHRQFHPREVEALLHYNGFELVGANADFMPGPLHGEADTIVWVAKKRGARVARWAPGAIDRA